MSSRPTARVRKRRIKAVRYFFHRGGGEVGSRGNQRCPVWGVQFVSFSPTFRLLERAHFCSPPWCAPLGVRRLDTAFFSLFASALAFVRWLLDTGAAKKRTTGKKGTAKAASSLRTPKPPESTWYTMPASVDRAVRGITAYYHAFPDPSISVMSPFLASTVCRVSRRNYASLKYLSPVPGPSTSSTRRASRHSAKAQIL